jgi:isopentenyl diphosphate isomerase/L-lactate dehydrogenase-like FMN-dependent dehydrogenase
VVSNITAELDLTMSLTGARTLADITTDLLRPSRDFSPSSH